MKKTCLIILISAIIPFTAFALSYEKKSLMYTDAPFLPAEAAGISVLTNLNAVEGYPDGAFYPKRTLNRAEFLKIAFASHPTLRAASSDASNCFPDVNKNDWFSMYVCLAKKRGIISGYPDGTFKPADPVKYAEALKMLGELYSYTAYVEENAQWWEIYLQAAANHKTLLPINLSLDAYLSRGQMARLAASYRAEYEGELEYYRRAEAGEDVKIPEESNSSSESSQTSSSAFPSVSSSSVSSEAQKAIVPTKSKLLIAGKEYQIGDGVLYAIESDVQLRIIKVILHKEAKSISKVFLRDTKGTQIAELKLDSTDKTNETWIAQIPIQSGGYVFPHSNGTTYVIDAQLKGIGSGGFSGERIQIKSVFIIVGKVSNPSDTFQVVPSSAHYPIHQTVLSKITRVENILTGTGNLVTGTEQKIAGFIFFGENADGNSALRLENLSLRMFTSYSVVISSIKISSGTLDKHDCSLDSDDHSIVNCSNIPASIGALSNGDRVLELYANIDVQNAGDGAEFKMAIDDGGSIETGGDVRFSDGSGSFNWIEQTGIPLAVGKTWVKQ